MLSEGQSWLWVWLLTLWQCSPFSQRICSRIQETLHKSDTCSAGYHWRAIYPCPGRSGGFLLEVTPKLSHKGWLALTLREKRKEGFPGSENSKCKGKKARESTASGWAHSANSWRPAGCPTGWVTPTRQLCDFEQLPQTSSLSMCENPLIIIHRAWRACRLSLDERKYYHIN